jgi:NTE family protein
MGPALDRPERLVHAAQQHGRAERAMLSLRRLISQAVPDNPLRVSLALQGGGAHGAFTWGVLDRLLEEPGLEIAAVSGTSAGAVNAVALAWGWCRGGREGARQQLDRLWRSIGRAGRGTPFGLGAFSAFALDMATHLFSPYQLNPLGIDPLRELLTGLVDFAALRRNCPMPLLVAATQVRTGRCRLFREHELTPEMVLASACLPQIHRAVEIEGELHWDGGFSSNPPVVALAGLGCSRRLLVVRINPAEVGEPPRRAAAIRHRTAQLVFSRPLADELAQLEALQRVASGPLAWLQPRLRRLARLDVQILDGDETLALLDPATKLAPEMRLLDQLRQEGRLAADRWLRRQRDGKGDAWPSTRLLPAPAVARAPG